MSLCQKYHPFKQESFRVVFKFGAVVLEVRMPKCVCVCVYIGRKMYAFNFLFGPPECNSSVLGCQDVYMMLGTHLGARYVLVPKERSFIEGFVCFSHFLEV